MREAESGSGSAESGSELAEETLVSQGSNEWLITKRSVAAGIYQVNFIASITFSEPAAPGTVHSMQAVDFGFIRVVPAPLRAIIDGGTSVRWGSTESVSVDGSLSYDSDIGPGNRTGMTFAWSCRDSVESAPLRNDCFGAFVEGANAVTVSINASLLEDEKTYVLRLTVSKDTRNAFAEMSFEIAAGERPQVALR